MKNQAGVVVGIVVNLDDPNGQGRIQVKFPWLPDRHSSSWAPVAAAFAGKGRGAFLMPEVGDEVLVAFEHGEFDHPFIVGFLWNGADPPPSDDPRERLIRSLNGHQITLYDPTPAAGDQGHVRLEDAHGNVVELSNARISIRGVATIDIQAPTVTINGRPVAPTPNPI